MLNYTTHKTFLHIIILNDVCKLNQDIYYIHCFKQQILCLNSNIYKYSFIVYLVNKRIFTGYYSLVLDYILFIITKK